MQNEHGINSAVLLYHILTHHDNVKIGVQGESMEPTLYAGDTIQVVKEEYRPGDILVFTYKNSELLVHRYVGERHGIILCKGDNSLRLEDIDKNAIIGKVKMIQFGKREYSLPPLPDDLISMSWQIGRLFHRNRYNAVLTRQEPIYLEFQKAIAKYALFRKNIRL